jgi:O-methyltransferase
MNYGFLQREDECRWVRTEDMPHRHSLSLVRHVFSGMDIAGRSLLEVGSGRGGNCYYLAAYAGAGSVCGLEASAGNLRFCHDRFRFAGVKFVRGDAESLPFRDSSFDLVLNLESSHCYGDLPRFLHEVWRVLRPQGLFCLADLWRWELMDRDWDVREQALTGEFEILSSEDISTQVLAALEDDSGLLSMLRRMSAQRDHPVLDRILLGTEALRGCLATGRCSYRVWHMRKRAHGRVEARDDFDALLATLLDTWRAADSPENSNP